MPRASDSGSVSRKRTANSSPTLYESMPVVVLGFGPFPSGFRTDEVPSDEEEILKEESDEKNKKELKHSLKRINVPNFKPRTKRSGTKKVKEWIRSKELIQESKPKFTSKAGSHLS